MIFYIEENIFYYKKGSNLYLMKIQIHFYMQKNSNLYLMKTQIIFVMQKNSDLYLMKIQTSFYVQKNFRSIFNENTDLFVYAKKFQIYI